MTPASTERADEARAAVPPGAPYQPSEREGGEFPTHWNIRCKDAPIRLLRAAVSVTREPLADAF